MLVYECPKTRLRVTTSIEASESELARMRRLSISVWCGHCQTSHIVLATDMRSERTPDGPTRRAVA
jgi:hypothetical protein